MTQEFLKTGPTLDLKRGLEFTGLPDQIRDLFKAKVFHSQDGYRCRIIEMNEYIVLNIMNWSYLFQQVG
jgi:hypothetical protein